INQLILNFGFGDSADRKLQTQAVIARVVADGTCYVAGAVWREDWVMRISISSASTTEHDIDLSADAVVRAWRQVQSGH
ncbi:MAG: aspartate aminotransferase family protein, partial [Devosia sp.]|nr:aspartate aminotransferase family protein [Devosia sp.]